MKRLLVSDEPNNFDVIRIAMALVVVWSHSFALYFGSEDSEPLSLLTSGAFNSGNIAVDVFFMVSGFLILKSWDRSKTTVGYLRKRVARIYPGYLVSIALCAFVLLPLYAGTRYSIGGVVETIGRNLLLKGWFVNPDPFTRNPASALNGSLWSIPLEFWCYLGVIAFGVLPLASRRWTLTLGLMTVIALHLWVDITGRILGGGILGQIVGWPNLWFRMAPCFMVGMMVYLLRDVLPRSGYAAAAGVVILIVGVRAAPLTGDVLRPIVVGYCVFYLAFSRQLFRAAAWGDFSYGTYLYAFPIQQLLLAFTQPPFWAFVTAAMLLSLAAGALSWFSVERWFLDRKKHPAALAST